VVEMKGQGIHRCVDVHQGQGTQWCTMHPVLGLQVQEGGIPYMLYSKLDAPYTQQCSSFPIHYSSCYRMWAEVRGPRLEIRGPGSAVLKIRSPGSIHQLSYAATQDSALTHPQR
jgi:hypothetical protein